MQIHTVWSKSSKNIPTSYGSVMCYVYIVPDHINFFMFILSFPRCNSMLLMEFVMWHSTDVRKIQEENGKCDV